METHWNKIKDKIPEFDKPVIVKTSKNIYAVVSLTRIISSKFGTHYDNVFKAGTHYRWNLNNVCDNFEKYCGTIVEWHEIPE